VLLLLSTLRYADQTDPITSAGLHVADRAGDPLYPFAAAYTLVLAGLSLANLWRGYRHDSSEVRRRQLRPLLIATALAALGGLYVTAGIVAGVDLPELPRDIAFGVAVALLGFAVARHNALVEGRVIESDLLYVFLAVGSLTAVAVLLAELLYSAGHVFSFLTLVLVMAVTISVLMLYDGVRTALDRLFYRDQFRQLRANLRSLANEAGTGLSLPEQLEAVLAWLRATLSVEHGLIALAGEGGNGGFVVLASQGPAHVGQTLPQSPLLGAEITALAPDTWHPIDGDAAQAALAGMALLAPIAIDGSQVGALLLGPRSAGQPYADEDLMLLDDVVEQLAAVIRTARLQAENARAINAMVTEFRERERAMQRQVQELLVSGGAGAQPGKAGVSQEQFVAEVEDALRRLHDYPALGEHPLARLAIVDQKLATAGPGGAITHIDRGKALNKVMVQAIHKLRPEGVPPNPHTVPPREWHQFIVLHDSYVLDELNRDIMSKLYIGEGTFNRTRRRALQGVARALSEMEEAQRKTMNDER
jgi:GAF domain-containing protein